jgi:hypothetical protein
MHGHMNVKFDYEMSKSFAILRHTTNCRQISVESRTRAVWNSSFLNMYIVIKMKFLMSTAAYSTSQEMSLYRQVLKPEMKINSRFHIHRYPSTINFILYVQERPLWAWIITYRCR